MIRFKRILIDASISSSFLTSQILESLSDIPHKHISVDEASDRLRGIHPEAALLPEAKQTLMITRNRGSFLKPMDTSPGIRDPNRSDAFRFDLFQGCALDCRYCFCQCYLSCHHTIVFANLEDSLSEIKTDAALRLVTGDIADSLLLGKASVLAHHYMSQFVSIKSTIELRSKCPLPDNWLLLDNNMFQIDWSMTTPAQWRLNEPGTASPAQRADSAAKALKSGFRVGIRFDPIQPDLIDKDAFYKLLKYMYNSMKPFKPAAFTLGSYKMSSELLEKIRKRFPQNPIPGYEWSRCPDGKTRPFKSIRLHSYNVMIELINDIFPSVPVSLSMEPSYILNFFES